MTRLWPSIAKEFRALLPLWAACMLAIGLYPLADSNIIESVAVLAYAFGSLALGAHVIGHEHAHHTLGILLAQPIDRRRLLLTKLAVLSPLLATMGLAAWLVLPAWSEPQTRLSPAFLPPLGALFAAPWFTMLFRNPHGGALVTSMVAAWSLLVTTMMTAAVRGVSYGEAEQAAFEVWLPAIYAFGVVTAIPAWRMFMRLEAIEGGGREIHLPRWFGTAASPRAGNPVWQLVKKELRLQQLAFVMAGLYVATWAAWSLRMSLAVESMEPAERIAGPLMAVYLAGVALLVGSLASAEERRCGMLESQQLLPMSASRQWAIKTAVALVVALAIAIGLPAMLVLAGGPAGALRGELPQPLMGAALIVMVTTCSLYVSSLSSSGVRALAAAFAFVMATFVLLEFVGREMVRRFSHSITDVDGPAIILTSVTFTAILMAFAAANHRTSSWTARRVVWQLACAAAVIVVGFPLIVAVIGN